ncbi:hypothetical protein AVEN_212385-1 [Araneus ventricosus]|uniref:Uncharacterized protein n=1 Tax=Araneus ventricosus TaxID=182803 RepID=A0A4Y2E4D7_ARAVE|nr:hypothetical protein AVEN_84434-1 [Araneus ventricosus]GBM22695.1 hypothetical protein AVEN_212385-1 [Araneus ventricosus]
MKPNSPSQRLIEGFSPSKENYLKALDLLKSRFGKDEFLIEFYFRELLSLSLKKSSSVRIAQLYEKLDSLLRALESLDITKEKYATMLYPLVESAVADNIFKIWESRRVNKQAPTKNPDNCLTKLLYFLRIEVEEGRRNESSSRAAKVEGTPLNPPSAAAFVSTSKMSVGEKQLCVFCEPSVPGLCI